MDYPRQRALLVASRLVHARWYERGYPDVAATGLHPVDHYLRIGAALGRNPSSRFDTRFYLAANPSAAASPLNPLAHYQLHGRTQGLPCLPAGAGGEVDSGGMGEPADRARVRTARMALLELGLTGPALADLEALAQAATDARARAMAAYELGLWALRQGGAQRAREALEWLDRAETVDLRLARQAARARLIAHHAAGQPQEGHAAYEDAALAGLADADVMLTRATLDPSPDARLSWINAVLEGFALPALALLPASGGPTPYDRLTTASTPPPVTDGPLVTVLVAAWQAGATLPTALRALTEQSWRNLEILVLDDASPDPDTEQVAQAWAARDPRIRLIRMARNGGAYVARNHGLAQARGDFVTLHDADDWAHPLRIETQMRHLLDNPEVLGCTSRQARCDADLRFTRLAGIGTNVSSFLFRRAPVTTRFGGWDEVRVAADSELIARIRSAHGPTAVTELQTGPLAFQRESPGSAINDPVMGIPGFRFGARRAYAEAHAHHRLAGGRLCYAPGSRPFPIPAPLAPMRGPRGQVTRLPLVLASDWRHLDSGLTSDLRALDALRDGSGPGVQVGLVELYRHARLGQVAQGAMAAAVRARIDGRAVRQLVYGESLGCDLLVLRDPACILHPHRYLPRIRPEAVRLLLDRPPEGGNWARLLEGAAVTLRDWLGPEALERTLWQPADPLIRAQVAAQAGPRPAGIAIAAEDWPDLPGEVPSCVPARGPAVPGGRLRVGRHMPDPCPGLQDSGTDPQPGPQPGGSASDPVADLRGLAAAAGDSVQIHLLASGRLPGLWSVPQSPGWTVEEIGARSPSDFLAGLDAWIAPGAGGPGQPRSGPILEAMAAGVPVILNPAWRPMFGPAAGYAEPAQALDCARALLADPTARAARMAAAWDHLRHHHSPSALLARLRAAGVRAQGQAPAGPPTLP